MSEVRDRYPDPGAFRLALTQRLRRLADSSPWTLAELQRQFAYDRSFVDPILAGTAHPARGTRSPCAGAAGSEGHIVGDDIGEESIVAEWTPTGTASPAPSP